MPVNLKGKQYHTVAERVTAFRESCPATEGWAIRTEIHTIDDAVVIVRAGIVDPEGRTIAEGHAEEVRTNSGVNSTSALENCETSAVGRALAAAGWGGGGEYASADEVAGAIQSQSTGQTTQAARMTEEQRQTIIRLSEHPAFDPAEGAKYATWAKQGRTNAAAATTIERLQKMIAEYEK